MSQIRQSEFAELHKLTPVRVRELRDQHLKEGEDWHAEGRAIYWTDAAADRGLRLGTLTRDTVKKLDATTNTNSGDVTLVNNTNGLTISSQALTMGLATDLVAGTVSTTTQSFTGAKTFLTSVKAACMAARSWSDFAPPVTNPELPPSRAK